MRPSSACAAATTAMKNYRAACSHWWELPLTPPQVGLLLVGDVGCTALMTQPRTSCSMSLLHHADKEYHE
jgi:hypothetical protein